MCKIVVSKIGFVTLEIDSKCPTQSKNETKLCTNLTTVFFCRHFCLFFQCVLNEKGSNKEHRQEIVKVIDYIQLNYTQLIRAMCVGGGGKLNQFILSRKWFCQQFVFWVISYLENFVTIRAFDKSRGTCKKCIQVLYSGIAPKCSIT